VALAKAIKTAGFVVYRPQDPLASDESLSETWLAANPPQVGLKYSSGLEVYVEPSVLGDPKKRYQHWISQGTPGHIEAIFGVTSFVIPGNSGQGTPASVDLVLNGVHVAIVGDSSVDELRRVAATIVTSP
jgi:hypothetical protein